MRYAGCLKRIALKRAEDLLLVLESYAPNVGSEALCSEIYFKAVDDGVPEDDRVLMLAEYIVSGLKEDKWPWS